MDQNTDNGIPNLAPRAREMTPERLAKIEKALIAAAFEIKREIQVSHSPFSFAYLRYEVRATRYAFRVYVLRLRDKARDYFLHGCLRRMPEHDHES